MALRVPGEVEVERRDRLLDDAHVAITASVVSSVGVGSPKYVSGLRSKMVSQKASTPTWEFSWELMWRGFA
jgi:hypothetical protein